MTHNKRAEGVLKNGCATQRPGYLFRGILQFRRPKKNNRSKKITVLKIGVQKTKGGTLGKSKGGPLVKSNFQGSPPWFLDAYF